MNETQRKRPILYDSTYMKSWEEANPETEGKGLVVSRAIGESLANR